MSTTVYSNTYVYSSESVLAEKQNWLLELRNDDKIDSEIKTYFNEIIKPQ